MPVSVGGKRLGPPPDRLLDGLASLWVEAIAAGKELRRLEEKAARQQHWLDDNRADSRYPARVGQAIVTFKEFEYYQIAVHNLAKRANELTGLMDPVTKEEARRCIHAWAALGSPGVYAIAWELIPDPAWLDEIEDAS